MNSIIFTSHQKYAIISILILIMEADGVIDPNEVDFLNKVYKDFSISESELELISQYDLANASQIIREMPYQERAYAIKLFIGMAKCDGYAHPKELEIINALGN